MMNDPTEGLVTKISEWIINMTLLNLLWFLFTLLGGVLFGWAPATVALMAIWRQQARSTERVMIWKSFWDAYRENFLKANAMGWILMVAGASLIFYSYTLVHWEGVLMWVFAALFLMITIIFMIVAVFIFPVYNHYDLPFVENFKYAFVIGLTHLHFFIIMVVSIIVIFWSYTFLPGLLLVFAVSFPSMCIMQLALVVFEKIEEKQLRYANHIKKLELNKN